MVTREEMQKLLAKHELICQALSNDVSPLRQARSGNGLHKKCWNYTLLIDYNNWILNAWHHFPFQFLIAKIAKASLFLPLSDLICVFLIAFTFLLQVNSVVQTVE